MVDDMRSPRSGGTQSDQRGKQHVWMTGEEQSDPEGLSQALRSVLRIPYPEALTGVFGLGEKDDALIFERLL